MYRGFELKDIPFYDSYYEVGKTRYNQVKKEINKELDKYISPSGTINGSSLQENWFPQMECDVFISHSHKDNEKAIALSGLLNSVGLNCFVDSCIWGYAEDLQKAIDKAHCYNEISKTYDYDLRNITTSHVHMMLSNALFRMIDSSECLFFLNSPSSIKIDGALSKAVSPWIYSEISITQIIRKKTPDRNLLKGESRNFSDDATKINVEYDINLSHLVKMENEDLEKWIFFKNINTHKLDQLYKYFPTSRHNTLHS